MTGSVDRWSPPTDSGATPASQTLSKNVLMRAIESITSTGLTGVSPRSAQLHSEKGLIPLARLTLRIMVERSRT